MSGSVCRTFDQKICITSGNAHVYSADQAEALAIELNREVNRLRSDQMNQEIDRRRKEEAKLYRPGAVFRSESNLFVVTSEKYHGELVAYRFGNNYSDGWDRLCNYRTAYDLTPVQDARDHTKSLIINTS